MYVFYPGASVAMFTQTHTHTQRHTHTHVRARARVHALIHTVIRGTYICTDNMDCARWRSSVLNEDTVGDAENSGQCRDQTGFTNICRKSYSEPRLYGTDGYTYLQRGDLDLLCVGVSTAVEVMAHQIIGYSGSAEICHSVAAGVIGYTA